MEKTKVSVITVCYNAVGVIEKTIQSVINQTYDNVEYIIIDGASTDGTVDIINKYIDKISFFVSEPDNGIYDAMNKGIDLSTGEWINFMNAGDEFADVDVVERIFSTNRKHCDVIFGNTIHVYGTKKERIMGEYYPNKYPKFGHQSSFSRSELLKKYHFNIKYKVCADYDFFYKIYGEGCLFQYCDTDISLYDLNGYSTNHRYILYKEHCEIEKKKVSIIKTLKLKIEDFLPKIVMKYVCYFRRVDKI